ncbi:MAG: very short patch repair endonuclease [Desulfobacteria bacterium]
MTRKVRSKRLPQRRDRMTPSQRSYCMSRVRSRNTSLEVLVAEELRRRKLLFKCHVEELPGCPDIVFQRKRVAVFVDGDFWHGWRYPTWEHKLNPYWRDKIAGNRRRDQKNFRKLRRLGWAVIRLWEHTIKNDLPGSISKIQRSVLC